MRIDPITADGKFDTEFSASEDYDQVVDIFKKYLKAEGFSNNTGEYIIAVPIKNGPACWHVKVDGFI